MPQVAFAGRSNAGKSTLVNELCGRSGTAAVSRRPGSTQELFFFKVCTQFCCKDKDHWAVDDAAGCLGYSAFRIL